MSRLSRFSKRDAFDPEVNRFGGYTYNPVVFKDTEPNCPSCDCLEGECWLIELEIERDCE